MFDLKNKKVIVTGAGRAFCAGADLEERKNMTNDDTFLFLEKINQLFCDIENLTVPTIASINGAAIGGGLELALCCDFRIASEDAILGYPEINLGINLNWFGLPLAVRLIGPARAKKMVIGGENENAETLLSWGFYDEVHPKKDLMNAKSNLEKIGFTYYGIGK